MTQHRTSSLPPATPRAYRALIIDGRTDGRTDSRAGRWGRLRPDPAGPRAAAAGGARKAGRAVRQIVSEHVDPRRSFAGRCASCPPPPAWSPSSKRPPETRRLTAGRRRIPPAIRGTVPSHLALCRHAPAAAPSLAASLEFDRVIPLALAAFALHPDTQPHQCSSKDSTSSTITLCRRLPARSQEAQPHLAWKTALQASMIFAFCSAPIAATTPILPPTAHRLLCLPRIRYKAASSCGTACCVFRCRAKGKDHRCTPKVRSEGGLMRRELSRRAVTGSDGGI